LERAAERMRGPEATRRLVHAGTLIESADPERACQILRRALEEDPGCVQGMAHLARMAVTVGEWEEAQQAAGRALDVGANPEVAPELDAVLRFKTAMAGGHAARELGRMDAAARFYAGAAELDSESSEALEGEADALIALGDLQGAGRALEKRLALAGENPNSARHLSIVARSLEARGDREEALGRFREALRLDPGDADAHDGVIRMHADAGRIDEAVAACEAWAQVASGGADRAARLMRAAKLELANARTESAESHLRASVDADPTAARAWLLLVELLWEASRLAEAFEASSEALRNVRDAGATQARISLVHARLLESRGESCAATEAYAEAAKHDTRCIEAALAQAALLGAASRWSDAAEVLGTFVSRHPDPDEPALARVLHERGLLLAGPLGDVEEAVRCYERAVVLEPTMIEARESLARLLTHVPERWRDAVEHHRSLLVENPVRADSLRDLVAIARERGDAALVDTGLVLLQTLEIESPGGEVPSALPLRLAETLRLESETWEKLRYAAQAASGELSEVLDVSKLPLEVDEDQGPVAAFRAALQAAEGELSAPALVGLPSENLASTMTALATVALDPEAARGTQEAERLSRRVGRRTRNKLRRALEGLGPSDVDAVDFDAWQRELRGLAAASAVDRTGGDLRSALIALSDEAAGGTDDSRSEGTDQCAIHASEPARRLLAHVTSAWCARLAATA
jgi:tetratricopeptide (TPR) repeat protein